MTSWLSGGTSTSQCLQIAARQKSSKEGLLMFPSQKTIPAD